MVKVSSTAERKEGKTKRQIPRENKAIFNLNIKHPLCF
jgi:hypothetical protein